MNDSTDIIEPGAIIGHLGDGQLARQLMEAAARLGFRGRVIGPGGPESSAGRLTPHAWAWSKGGPTKKDDIAVIDEFADGCDVITCEWESVPVWVLEHLIHRDFLVRPGPNAFHIASDRALEKKLFRESGLTTADYVLIDAVDKDQVISEAQFASLSAARALTYPARLKTRREGYDGNGQVLVEKFEDLYLAVAILQDQGKLGPYILEGHVPFAYESSVIATRGVDGRIVFYPSGKNEHKDGILRRTHYASGLMSEVLQTNLQAATAVVANQLGYIGTLGVEFFILEDGSFVVNEVAPRVHNSGHWTQDGCDVDQFAMHIRAICGWSLPQPRVICAQAEMVNLLTPEDVQNAPIEAQTPGVFLHSYDKAPREGQLRKCGHLNRVTY